MTRDEINDAVGIVREGRPTHSIYAIEDAKRALRSVARYYWRQGALMTACVLWPAFLAPRLLPAWPLLGSYLAGGLAGSLLFAIVIKLTPLRRLLAPPGLSPGDVAKAAHVRT